MSQKETKNLKVLKRWTVWPHCESQPNILEKICLHVF